MIALDNFTFSNFVKSKDLRNCIKEFTKKELPSSISTISKMVQDYSQMVVDHLSTEMSAIEKATITMDKWSSRSRRYLNVNLHSDGKSYCLGLIPIFASATSSNIFSLLQQKLMEFNVPLRKIIATTNDGAAVMKKIQFLAGIEMQLCYAHAIHLGKC